MTSVKNKLSKRSSYALDEVETHEYSDKIRKSSVGILDLARSVWSAEHTLPEHIKSAAKKVIDRGPEIRLGGLPELREAIAEKLERDNDIDVDPETQVLVTTGGFEAIYLAISAFVDPSDEVTMGDPGYLSGYEPNVLMAGGSVVHIPVREDRNFRLCPEDLEKRLTRRTKIISIISPENPTGAIIRKENLEKIAEIAKKFNLVVLSNDVYEKLIYDGRTNSSIASFPDISD